MRRNKKQYIPELYKGTTSLRVFLFLSLGVLMVNTVGLPPLWMTISGCMAVVWLIAALLLRLKDAWLTVGFVLLAVSAGGVWSLRGNPSTIDGHAASIVIVSPQKGVGNHLACDAMVSGTLLRLNTDSTLTLSVGEVVEANIKVYWPNYYGGRFNYPLYLYRKGYDGVAWLDSSEIVSRGQGSGWSMAAFRRMCVARFARAGISDRNVGLVSAITVGDKSQLVDEVQDDFRDAGVAHVLVVSGMHVGFLFLLINLLYRRANRKWVVALAGIVVMWAYAVLVGLTAPVCRAALMFSMMLLCRLSSEEYNSLHALSLSAVVLVLADPLVLYDVGFQLSFLAVFSIMVFYPVIPALGGKWWGLTRLWNVARLSLSAQMLALPVIIYYFGQIPLYFLLTNILIALFTPAVFILGLLTLLPSVGTLTGGLLDILLDGMCGTVSWVAHLPGSVLSVNSTFPELLFDFCLIMLIGNILRSPSRENLPQ